MNIKGLYPFPPQNVMNSKKTREEINLSISNVSTTNIKNKDPQNYQQPHNNNKKEGTVLKILKRLNII